MLEIKPLTKQTTPPKPYTEDTLLKAMKIVVKMFLKKIQQCCLDILLEHQPHVLMCKEDKSSRLCKEKGKSYSITDLGKI